MIKTFEANPNTSCGLRPRLRRDLDHAEREEDNFVWLSEAQRGCPDVAHCLEATTGSPDASLSAGIDDQDAPSSCQRLTKGCPDAAEADWRRPRAAQTPLCALELIFKTRQAAVRGSQKAAWTLQGLSGGDHGQPGRPKSS